MKNEGRDQRGRLRDRTGKSRKQAMDPSLQKYRFFSQECDQN